MCYCYAKDLSFAPFRAFIDSFSSSCGSDFFFFFLFNCFGPVMVYMQSYAYAFPSQLLLRRDHGLHKIFFALFHLAPSISAWMQVITERKPYFISCRRSDQIDSAIHWNAWKKMGAVLFIYLFFISKWFSNFLKHSKFHLITFPYPWTGPQSKSGGL